MNNKPIEPIDKAIIMHYVIYGNKTQAFLYGKGSTTKAERINYSKVASAYFAKENIKALLRVELQNVKDNLNSIADRVGAKNPIQQNTFDSEGMNDESTELNKEQAKQVLIKLINTNKTDAKTVSQAMQLLSKLEQWEKEKTVTSSNITLYELPKKSST